MMRLKWAASGVVPNSMLAKRRGGENVRIHAQKKVDASNYVKLTADNDNFYYVLTCDI